VLGVGAGLVERRSIGSCHWVTLTDPDGNQFCVAQAESENASGWFQPAAIAAG
jgi:hypothetical protein